MKEVKLGQKWRQKAGRAQNRPHVVIQSNHTVRAEFSMATRLRLATLTCAMNLLQS